MIVRIGVSDAPREIEVELDSDTDPGGLRADIEKAVGKADTMLWLTDKHGRQIGVPAAKIAYVDIGAPTNAPRIGFGA
jgi:hypothetical protein